MAFDNILLKTRTVDARATPEGIEVSFAAVEEGGKALAAYLKPRENGGASTALVAGEMSEVAKT